MPTIRVALSSIKPNPDNPRIIKDDKFRKLVASIRSFPEMLELRPIVVNADNVVLGGNMRLRACQEAGMKEVPVLRADTLTPDQQREFIIKDNVGFGEWNWDELANTWDAEELDAWGLDVPFVEKTEEGLTDPDEVPEPPANPITKPGDLIILGRHRLLCGDSTKSEDISRLMEGEKADATISDPPYGIGYKYAEHDDSDNEQNAALVAAAFDNGPEFIVWTPGLNNLARDIARFGKAKVAVWFKKFAAAGNGLGGASVWEPILIVGRPPKTGLKTDVLEIMTDREFVDGVSLRELHSCPKPVALYLKIIESFTEPGSKIYEPFCGSGTTLIAAEQSGRKCYGLEISPAYCDVIVKRWEDFTGEKAVRETGKEQG